ncbi:hypothetical protein ACQJBY_019471 [Aegilops geniculata]
MDMLINRTLQSVSNVVALLVSIKNHIALLCDNNCLLFLLRFVNKTRLLKRLDFPEMKFSLYFLGYEDLSAAPADPVQRTGWTFGRKATIELTHNWGTESDPEFKGYHNGNSDPRGFGHIGVTVDDVYKACERFESLGVEFVKKPDDGKMKGIAFIKDPDGYWIEIFDLKRIGEVTATAS